VLLGDASKAKTQLGWSPTISFDDLVKMMVESDLAAAESDAGSRERRFPQAADVTASLGH
jgi:GDPmannose 4,6-dehydratase